MIIANVTCSQTHSSLSQCVDLEEDIGVNDRCQHTAGVICATVTITRDMSTKDEGQGTSTRATNLTLPVVGAVVALLILGAIATVVIVIIIIVVLRKRRGKKQKNRYRL